MFKMVLILKKRVIEKIIDHNSNVRCILPLDITYVHCKVASILYRIDIYIAIWASKLFPLRVCYN